MRRNLEDPWTPEMEQQFEEGLNGWRRIVETEPLEVLEQKGFTCVAKGRESPGIKTLKHYSGKDGNLHMFIGNSEDSGDGYYAVASIGGDERHYREMCVHFRAVERAGYLSFISDGHWKLTATGQALVTYLKV